MLKTLLKFIFAIVLCYWLVSQGKLDFNLVAQSFHSGHLWLIGLLLLSTRLFICALRFKTLLDTKSNHPTSYWKIFSFDAIGNLFSIIFPAGDLVRFLYYKNLGAELSSGLIVAFITLDRIIGLMGLMALVSFISIFQYENILSMSPQLLSLMMINAAVLVTLGFLMLFTYSKWFPKKKLQSLIASNIKKPEIQKVFIDLLNTDLNLKTFIKCFLLSILNHSVVLGSFIILISPFIPLTVSTINIVTILPIGFIGSALPISPGGLGVGHVLFDNLFKLIEIDHGASLYNIYFVFNILVCLIGLIPYLFQRKNLPSKQAGINN